MMLTVFSSVLIAICLSSFKNCLFISFSQFVVGLFIFLFGHKSSLFILDTNSLWEHDLSAFLPSPFGFIVLCCSVITAWPVPWPFSFQSYDLCFCLTLVEFIGQMVKANSLKTSGFSLFSTCIFFSTLQSLHPLPIPKMPLFYFLFLVNPCLFIMTHIKQ